MRILGIESSCDETAAAVVTEEGEVLSDVVASQHSVHAPYGGVVPELASRAHLQHVVPVIEEALAQAGGIEAIDGIAVTSGPGLIGALHVGVQAAKAIAFARRLPIVAVDHLTAHLLAVHLRRGSEPHDAVPYPYVALLASGGHTAVYEVATPDRITLLGQTRDDAAGEAFDKVAKLIGLGYPGGPLVDRFAASGDPRALDLPLGMASRESLEMSFSGLKTSVAAHVRKHGVPSSDQARADLCASFQRVVVETLVRKLLRASEVTGIRTLAISGGVAANRGLRARLREACDERRLALCIPPVASCTDNGAMIAYAGALRFAAGKNDGLGFEVYAKSPEVRRGKFVGKAASRSR